MISSLPQEMLKGRKHIFIFISIKVWAQSFEQIEPINTFLFVEIKKQKTKFALEKSCDYVYMTMTWFHQLLLMAPHLPSSYYGPAVSRVIPVSRTLGRAALWPRRKGQHSDCWKNRVEGFCSFSIVNVLATLVERSYLFPTYCRFLSFVKLPLFSAPR